MADPVGVGTGGADTVGDVLAMREQFHDPDSAKHRRPQGAEPGHDLVGRERREHGHHVLPRRLPAIEQLRGRRREVRGEKREYYAVMVPLGVSGQRGEPVRVRYGEPRRVEHRRQVGDLVFHSPAGRRGAGRPLRGVKLGDHRVKGSSLGDDVGEYIGGTAHRLTSLVAATCSLQMDHHGRSAGHASLRLSASSRKPRQAVEPGTRVGHGLLSAGEFIARADHEADELRFEDAGGAVRLDEVPADLQDYRAMDPRPHVVRH